MKSHRNANITYSVRAPKVSKEHIGISTKQNNARLLFQLCDHAITHTWIHQGW